MKRILALLFTAVMALSMVACGATNTPASSASAPAATETPAATESATPTPTPTATPTPEPTYDFGGMKITLAWPWPPRYTDPSEDTTRFQARIAEVEKELNIKFQWVGIDNGEYYDKMVANTMAGNNFGDIMFCPSYMLADWIQAGLTADLKPIADSVGIDLSDPSFNAIASTASTYNGVQYAIDKIPIEVNTGVIFNKKLLADAGLKSPYDCVKENTWNWDTLQQYAKALTVANADGTVKQWGFSSMNVQSVADMLILSNNSDMVDAKTDTVIADSEATLEALSVYQQMMAIDKTLRPGDPNDWESNIKAFANGSLAMMNAEQWVIDYINTMNPPDFGYVYFPKGPKATDYISTAGFFDFWIPKNLPLKTQQAALLAFSKIFDNLYPEMSKEDYFKMLGEKYLQDEEGLAIYADIQTRGIFKSMAGDRYGVDSWAVYNLLNTTDYTPQSAVAEQKPVMEAKIADWKANYKLP